MKTAAETRELMLNELKEVFGENNTKPIHVLPNIRLLDVESIKRIGDELYGSLSKREIVTTVAKMIFDSADDEMCEKLGFYIRD